MIISCSRPVTIGRSNPRAWIVHRGAVAVDEDHPVVDHGHGLHLEGEPVDPPATLAGGDVVDVEKEGSGQDQLRIAVLGAMDDRCAVSGLREGPLDCHGQFQKITNPSETLIDLS